MPYVKQGDDFIVTLSAEHFSGIERVEFMLDGEWPTIVTQKTPHPVTGYPEYLFPVGQLEDGYHTVEATVYANSGDVLQLTGDPLRFGTLNVRNNGLNAFIFQTGEYETVTVGATGDYPTIDAALAAGVEGMRVELEPGTTPSTSPGPTGIRRSGRPDRHRRRRAGDRHRHRSGRHPSGPVHRVPGRRVQDAAGGGPGEPVPSVDLEQQPDGRLPGLPDRTGQRRPLRMASGRVDAAGRHELARWYLLDR